jgi:hypothetical protein
VRASFFKPEKGDKVDQDTQAGRLEDEGIQTVSIF